MLLEDVNRVRSQSQSYTMKQKLLQSLSSFVRGPAQAYLYQTLGLLGAGAAAIGFAGVSLLTNKLNASAQRDALTNTYRDELAVMLGKDRKAITCDGF